MYETETKCPYWKSDTSDVPGDRTVSCHSRGDTKLHHDKASDKILSSCPTYNRWPLSEQNILLPDTNSRTGYIFFPSFNAGGSSTQDVTVTSPLQAGTLPDAAVKSGIALTVAEKEKFYEQSQ